jgi:co-chaperonin GroES (HSP10)
MRPLRDHILVKPDPINSLASRHILINARQGIHTSQQQLGRTGTVMAIGSCRMRWEDRNGKKAQRYRSQPAGLAVGDRVLYGEFEYPEVPNEPLGRLLVLSEADVIGVIDASD